MAIVPRVLGNASRFSVSRPGVSVLVAPRTSDYMAVDSSIPVERFIGGGIVFNKNTLTFGSVSLAGIVAVNSPTPLLVVIPINVGGVPTIEERMLIQFAPSGVTTQFAPYRAQIITNSGNPGAPYFRVFDPYGGAAATDYNQNNRNWAWFILKPPP